jgi:hypothetical protein
METLTINKLPFYSILVNNRSYTPPIKGINWPLGHRSVKNLPSNGWFKLFKQWYQTLFP